MKLQFELITPERVVAKQEVDQATLPTMDGEITVLPGHIPLVAQLVPGVLSLKNNGENQDVAVSGGFIQVADNKIKVLADTAERGENLDLGDIEEAKQRAAKVMQEAARGDDETFARAAAEMEKELARYRVAQKYKKTSQRLPSTNNDQGLTDDTGTV